MGVEAENFESPLLTHRDYNYFHLCLEDVLFPKDPFTRAAFNLDGSIRIIAFLFAYSENKKFTLKRLWIELSKEFNCQVQCVIQPEEDKNRS